MRKRILTVFLAAMVCAAAVTGCSGSGESDGEETQADNSTSVEQDEQVEQEEADMVYGEVVSVDESSITIRVGTMRERNFEEGEETPADGTAEEREQPEDGAFSMLDLTDEQREIPVTDSTDLQRRSFRMAFPNQEGGDDGERPQMPEGETGDFADMDGERPQMPESEAGDFADMDGERPQMPEGETGDLPQRDGMDSSDVMQNETITLADIAEGDTVGIVLNEDGTAQSISVFSMGGFSAE